MKDVNNIFQVFGTARKGVESSATLCKANTLLTFCILRSGCKNFMQEGDQAKSTLNACDDDTKDRINNGCKRLHIYKGRCPIFSNSMREAKNVKVKFFWRQNARFQKFIFKTHKRSSYFIGEQIGRNFYFQKVDLRKMVFM